MSCCNKAPRRVNYIINCNPVGPDVQDITISNINVEGQGLFFQKAGSDFQFYGLMNTDGYITVSLDADNGAISIDLDPNLIAGSIPDATTTVKGKSALATDAEAAAKGSTTKSLTPSNLAALNASTTTTGLVELATSPETVTGTDTQRATTPAGVKAALDATKAIQVVANAAARAGATPAYVGQLLYQTDTKATYFGASLAAGGWEGQFLRSGGTNVVGSTIFDLAVNQLLFVSTGGGEVAFDGVTASFYHNVNLSTAGARLQLDGVNIPDASLLGTSSLPGVPEYYQISDFLSVMNNIGYTVGTYTPSRSIPDASSITLGELANVVASLITDLAARKIPSIA